MKKDFPEDQVGEMVAKILDPLKDYHVAHALGVLSIAMSKIFAEQFRLNRIQEGRLAKRLGVMGFGYCFRVNLYRKWELKHTAILATIIFGLWVLIYG